MFVLNNLKNEAILRDLFIVQSWHLKKRSNSARLPQFLHLTTSKSKQFNYVSIYLSTYRSIYLSVYLSIDVSIYLSLCLSVCPFIYLPVYLQAWKPSYSARCLHFSKLTTSKTKQFCETSQCLNLTTSKTKQFCETSSLFKVDTLKNTAIQRDFLQKWKVECSADSLVPMLFAIFPLHLSKVLRLPRKIDARSYEVLHLSRKIILANLQIWCSKMQPLSGN